MGRSAANRAFRVGLGGLLLIAAGCNRSVSGSGTVTSTPVPVSPFSRLVVSNEFVVNVSFGDQENVTIRVDDNLLGHLDVGVSDGNLRVGLESGTSVRDATLHADVTARALSSIDVSRASQVHLSDPLTGQQVEVVVSGAGRLEGTAPVDLAKLELSGRRTRSSRGAPDDSTSRRAAPASSTRSSLR